MNYKEYINHLKTEACINVEPTHRCLLQCVFCTRQNPWEGKNKIKQARVSYGDLKLNHSKMIGDYFSSMTMCGNISDIIYHPNLTSVIKEIGKTNLNYFEFRTNGAGKSLDWWKEIVNRYRPTEIRTEIRTYGNVMIGALCNNYEVLI